jgi:tetratricopeptide (TPR) repeat protein
MDAVHHYGGYVAQSTGDGIFALFGAPIAHEDHPQRAVYAALRLQDQLKRYSDTLRGQGRLPLQARVGLNTGKVVVRSIATGEGHTEYTPIGHSTSLAARMQALAPVGSIAITKATRKFCEGYFTFKSLGPTVVKGVGEPVEVYEVIGLGPLRTRLQRAVGRGLTKFVGREREMEALRHAAERAKAGHGQVVAVMAEPGVGKSRLFYEFKATSQSEWIVVEAFSLSHGKATAYLPVLELLHDYCRISADDDARTRREKVNGKVLTLDRALEDTLPYLFAVLGLIEGDDPLVGMDAQVRRRRTHEAIKRVLLRESLNQPLMVIFEDLHWIDGESQALLNVLVDSIGTARMLLLVNYRPEYQHQWGSRTYYAQLRLDPLGRDSAEEMLRSLLGDDAGLAALKRLIIERTEGNPFFMEETVQVLLEEGVLVRNGGVKLTRPLSQFKIPPTVQSVLAARIDRLPAAGKELLQTLAVIGKDLLLELVKVVTGKGEEQLEPMLAELQMGEFIYEQPSLAGAEYTFKHALTQEVAYNSVLQERRKLLHERIAAALEAIFAENLDDYLPELAHHYSRSANRAKAFEFLHRAGDQAIKRATYLEGEAYFAAALDLVNAMPESPERDTRELQVRSSFTQALSVTKGYGAPEVLDMASRASALAEKTGDLSQLVQQQWAATVYAEVRGDLSAAAALADRLLEIAQREGSPACLGLGHEVQVEIRFLRGDFVGSEEHFTRGRPFFDAPGFVQTRGAEAATFGNASVNAWVTGRADAARERMRRCLEGIQRNPYDITTGQLMAAALHTFLGDFAQAEALAAGALSYSEQHGFPDLVAWSLPALGMARAGLGHTGEGVGLLRQAVAGAAESGVRVTITWVLTWLAQAQALDGAITDALRTIDDALQANPEELVCQPETYRVRGELRLRQGDSGVAEADFRKAIALAQKMKAKSWELRATTSLARLLNEQGKRDAARAMLAEIYGWFTEGFDTADLKDAKALLEELSN